MRSTVHAPADSKRYEYANSCTNPMLRNASGLLKRDTIPIRPNAPVRRYGTFHRIFGCWYCTGNYTLESRVDEKAQEAVAWEGGRWGPAVAHSARTI